MGIVMLVQSCVTLTKTVRDMHESEQAREPDRGRKGRTIRREA